MGEQQQLDVEEGVGGCETKVEGEEDKDYEGIQKEYDLILFGTGLVESIVACAAARAGKSVLHVDKYNFYGRENTSASLDQFLSRSRRAFNGEYGLDVDGDVDLSNQASEGSIYFNSRSNVRQCYERVIDFEDIDINSEDRLIESHRSVHKSHPSTIGYIMEKDSQIESAFPDLSDKCHPSFFRYVKDHRITKNRAVAKSRHFSIDSSCQLLLGSTISIDTMITSGVSKYLEFKSVEGIFYTNVNEELCPVPCSKGDIFTSKLLSALEKRSLMKFLQSTVDWGQSLEGNTATTLNERELAAGRALKRPQNKKELKSSEGNALLEEEVERKAINDFRGYLTAQKVPERLQDIITYALCLHSHKSSDLSDESDSTRSPGLTTKEGLTFLYEHINALGKFGETAFLTALYGSAELPQSFCRMCAVWGGTYVLRRSISKLLINEPIVEGDGPFTVSAICDSTGREIKCSSFVCNIEDWPLREPSMTYAFVLTRVSVVDAPLLPLDRSVAIIPPTFADLGNTEALYVIQQDSSVGISPDGALLIHMSTRISVPGCEVKCSIGEDPWIKMMEDEVFKSKAAQVVSNAVKFFHSIAKFDEICHTTSLRALRTLDTTKLTLANGRSIANVAVCGEIKHTIHSNDAFQQAKKIFSNLFPNNEFFPVPRNPENADDVRRNGDDEEDDDDLTRVLESIKTVESY